MAVFIPDVKPEDFNNSPGEKEVYEALKLLGKDYTVFYSLSWISIGNDRTIGEADFILFHPVHGIMVIEVKSGEIEYKGGKWIQTNRNSGQKKEISPYVQARKSQYEIFDRIIKHANRTRFTRPMLCYAVWFPSIEFKPNDELPPEAAVEITFDKKSLLNAQSVIEDAYDFWKDKLRVNTRPLSGDDTRCVMDVLCPYFHAVPKLGTTINESEHIYIRLTNQQIALLDFLVEQDTAVIHGLAGTGKTVLAIEKAKMLAAQGESVLFLCYNSFLRDSLRENNTIPGVVFHNAHSLAYEIMGATDSKIDDVLAEFEEYLEDDIGESRSYILEGDARERFRKWDNVKYVAEKVKDRRVPKKSYRNKNWGMEIKTNNRLDPEDGVGLRFGVVVTIKEMYGINRIDEFIKNCNLNGWLVNAIDIQNRIEIHEKINEEIRFD